MSDDWVAYSIPRPSASQIFHPFEVLVPRVTVPQYIYPDIQVYVALIVGKVKLTPETASGEFPEFGCSTLILPLVL
jgi:hypothetical protein